MLVPVGSEEKGHRTGMQAMLPFQNFTYDLSNAVVRGFPCGEYGNTLSGVTFRKELYLSGGPRAVDSFEHDESIENLPLIPCSYSRHVVVQFIRKMDGG